MIVLYEICIWLAYFDRKKTLSQEEQDARERLERLALREEKTAVASSDDLSAAEDWHDQDPPPSSHSDEAGDDGWHDEYAQQDPHAGDALPPLDDMNPPLLPEGEERRRLDP